MEKPNEWVKLPSCKPNFTPVLWIFLSITKLLNRFWLYLTDFIRRSIYMHSQENNTIQFSVRRNFFGWIEVHQGRAYMRDSACGEAFYRRSFQNFLKYLKLKISRKIFSFFIIVNEKFAIFSKKLVIFSEFIANIWRKIWKMLGRCIFRGSGAEHRC